MAWAGVLDEGGRLIARAEHPIDLLHPGEGQAVYRMEAVWQAVARASSRAASRPSHA